MQVFFNLHTGQSEQFSQNNLVPLKVIRQLSAKSRYNVAYDN